MVINDLSGIKRKVITFKHSLNRGIHSSPSKISMQNFVIQSLLTRIRLIKECMIFRFTLNDFSIIWSISYNASITGSSIHCDVMKRPGETVSAG